MARASDFSRLSRVRTHLRKTKTNHFILTDPSTTEIYTLSLHDALPISRLPRAGHLPRRPPPEAPAPSREPRDRKSTRLNSSHTVISYAVFCLKKKRPELRIARSLSSAAGTREKIMRQEGIWATRTTPQ